MFLKHNEIGVFRFVEETNNGRLPYLRAFFNLRIGSHFFVFIVFCRYFVTKMYKRVLDA